MYNIVSWVDEMLNAQLNRISNNIHSMLLNIPLWYTNPLRWATYGLDHEGAVVLFPGFAISW